jgi:hypothetical protein
VEAAPHAENLFTLGEALWKAGKVAEAKQLFAKFELQALREAESTDNANHELVAYYVDYAHEPQKALRIAKQELARRHDAYTLDAYAWALHASNDDARAASEFEKALAFGLRDPKVLEHIKVVGKSRPQAE